MKTPSKKLSLHKETLKKMSADELRRAAGGATGACSENDYCNTRQCHTADCTGLACHSNIAICTIVQY
jgi:hypothetical protein